MGRIINPLTAQPYNFMVQLQDSVERMDYLAFLDVEIISSLCVRNIEESEIRKDNETWHRKTITIDIFGLSMSAINFDSKQAYIIIEYNNYNRLIVHYEPHQYDWHILANQLEEANIVSKEEIDYVYSCLDPIESALQKIKMKFRDGKWNCKIGALFKYEKSNDKH